MCELFAMSSRRPTDITFSLRELAAHGGRTNHHTDGWGVAYVVDGDVQRIREPRPAANSACVAFLEQHAPDAAMVLSHIRRATRGAVSLRNTQPFVRELGGRMHVFIHNGHVPGVHGDPVLRLGHARPVGETDSEFAFCALLAALEPLWAPVSHAPGALADAPGADAGVPPLEDRIRVVEQFAARARGHGPANFIYTDGDALFAHGHERVQADRGVRPPGLHWLQRRCEPGPGAWLGGVHMGAHDTAQEVVLIASVPLSDEAWSPLPEGGLLIARGGEVLGLRDAVVSDLPGSDQTGRA